VLLAHGASLTIVNDEGKNALDLSQRPVRNAERAQQLAAVHTLLTEHAASKR
jgi:hypothetical protein